MQQSIFIAFISLIGIFGVSAYQNNLNYGNILKDLRKDLRYEFDQSGYDKPLIAQSVRLVYHDCQGGPDDGDSTKYPSICNGCITSTNFGSLGILDVAYNTMEDLYKSYGYDKVMSRADFWAACATEAIIYAVELDDCNKDKLPTIPYYFGRKDCKTSPKSQKDKAAPTGQYGWKDIYKWFSDNFDFNEWETVAIIGAHTLGEVNYKTSGYGTRYWTKKPFVFSNQYYIDMIDDGKKWTQYKVNCDSSFGCLYQWNDVGDSNEFVMLNCDMSMYLDIDKDMDYTTGQVDCDWKTCSINSETAEITENYAKYNQWWLNDFVYAYIKMITVGYNKDDLYVVNNNDY